MPNTTSVAEVVMESRPVRLITGFVCRVSLREDGPRRVRVHARTRRKAEGLVMNLRLSMNTRLKAIAPWPARVPIGWADKTRIRRRAILVFGATQQEGQRSSPEASANQLRPRLEEV